MRQGSNCASAQVAAFREEMTQAQVRYTLVSFSGVVHGFTNPNPDADTLADKFQLPLRYDANADAE